MVSQVNQADYPPVDDEKIVHIDKTQRLKGLFQQDPLELLRVVNIGLTTAYYRFVRRCGGSGTIFGSNTKLINVRNISIGRDCLFQGELYIRAGQTGSVTIGDRAALNSFVRIFGHGGVEIGEEAQLGPGTLITTTGHDYTDKNLETSFTKVTIGERVWTGANVTILPGVTIGANAVIGAGAVVNKDVPPCSVAVGVPARVVKTFEVES